MLSPAEAGKNAFGVGDALALALIAGFFLVCGYGAWQLRRLRRHGLQAANPRPLRLDGWSLAWPEGWDTPERTAGAWSAATNDHDGRVELHVLRAGAAGGHEPEPFLRAFLARRAITLDAWTPERSPGVHGEILAVEGRARRGRERGYFWLARVPGARPGTALVLFYSAAVLYGLADGFWLQQIAAAARDDADGAQEDAGAGGGAR